MTKYFIGEVFNPSIVKLSEAQLSENFEEERLYLFVFKGDIKLCRRFAYFKDIQDFIAETSSDYKTELEFVADVEKDD